MPFYKNNQIHSSQLEKKTRLLPQPHLSQIESLGPSRKSLQNGVGQQNPMAHNTTTEIMIYATRISKSTLKPHPNRCMYRCAHSKMCSQYRMDLRKKTCPQQDLAKLHLCFCTLQDAELHGTPVSQRFVPNEKQCCTMPK